MGIGRAIGRDGGRGIATSIDVKKTVTGEKVAVLSALSNAVVDDGATIGTVVGGISLIGSSDAYTFALTDDGAGDYIDIASTGDRTANLTIKASPDFASHQSVTVTVQATNDVDASVITRSYVISINEPLANLGTLTLSSTSFVTSNADTGTIDGATAGSTIEASGLPAGFTIDEVARTWAWDGTGSVSTPDITLTETLGGRPNSPNANVIGLTITAAPILSALSLSASDITEGSAASTVVGALQGITSGSTVTLIDDAGGRFTISGGNIVAGANATDFETATSHQITVQEELAGASNTPRTSDITITVANVAEAATLATLSLSETTYGVGVADSGTIIGAATGSTISATGLPAGFTVDGAARTWSWDGTGSASTPSIILTETLSDSPNSPNPTEIGLTIAGGGGVVSSALYQFEVDESVTSITGSGLTAGPLTQNGVMTTFERRSRGGDRCWAMSPPGNSDYDTPQKSFELDNYASITLNGTGRSLKEVHIKAMRGGSSVERGFGMKHSGDGFTAWIFEVPSIATVQPERTQYSNTGLDVPMSGDLEIRLYQSSFFASQTSEFDDIEFITG